MAPAVYLPAAALSFSFSRGSGPGGQNVNKVNTHATLTVLREDLAAVLPEDALQRLGRLGGHFLANDPPRLVIHASDSRSQLANRRSCLTKLREVLVQALHRPRHRRPTKPTKASRQRRLDAKKQRGQIKTNRQSPGDTP